MITILFEDEDILVIDKPAHLVVNRAQSVVGQTLQDWLEKQKGILESTNFTSDWVEQVPDNFTPEYGTPQEIFVQRSGIAHRLDKDTSGVMLIAKHPGSLLELLKQFRQREVKKKYTCLVHGTFAMKTGEINLPLGRRAGNRKLFGVVADGRPAVTNYFVTHTYHHFALDRLEKQVQQKNKKSQLYSGFSMVECFPKTGRTHQIRVHFAHLQHPLVGDTVYVGKKRGKLDSYWCKRQFLHASEIQFTHPRTKQTVTYNSPLPDDLLEALTYLS